MVFLGSFYNTEYDRTGVGAFLRVGEQEVLSGHYKGLNAPFRTIVTNLNLSIQEEMVHQFPLVFQAGNACVSRA